MKHGTAKKVWERILVFMVTLTLLLEPSNGNYAFLSQALASSSTETSSELVNGTTPGVEDAQNNPLPPSKPTVTPVLSEPEPEAKAETLSTDSGANAFAEPAQSDIPESAGAENKATPTVSAATSIPPIATESASVNAEPTPAVTEAIPTQPIATATESASVTEEPTPAVTEAIPTPPVATATESASVTNEPTPTASVAIPTAQPEIVPVSLKDVIRGANHAYLILADSEAGLYSGYGMSNAKRIGTVSGRGAILFATDYIPRDGKSAAVLVWFMTSAGVVNGYMSEDRLNTEPMNAAQAQDYMSRNGFKTGDMVLDKTHYTIANVSYQPQTVVEATPTMQEPTVLYVAVIADVTDGHASLYEAADDSSAVCATVQAGETVSVLSESGDWAYVLTDHGDRGYIQSALITKHDAQNANNENPTTAPSPEPTTSENMPLPTAEPGLDQPETSETQALETEAPTETPTLDLSVEPEPGATESLPTTPSNNPEATIDETVTPDNSETPLPTTDSSLDNSDEVTVEPSVSSEAEPTVTPETTDAELISGESPAPSVTPEATVSPVSLSELPEAIAYATVTLPSGTTPLYAEANTAAAIIDQLADNTYVGVLSMDNDWAYVYVSKGEGFLVGYVANTVLTVSVLSTEQPLPTPPPVVFIPLEPVNLPDYYLSIGTAEYDTSSAGAEEAVPVENAAPATDATGKASWWNRMGRLFLSGACAEEAGTASADIYTFIGADGIQYYRVYGIVNGVEGYYACDVNGVLVEPYQLVDIGVEQDTLATGIPSISTRGLVNFALSASAKPSSVPEYYSFFPAGENTTVYTFVGRDGVTYYRIYGTNNSGATGFFECDQYGENESANPVVLNDEYNNIAPYVYASLAAPTKPTGLTLVSSNPYLYSYPAADGTTQYRMYSVKLNDPTDTQQHWYTTDATGKVIKPLLNDNIQLDMNNLWVNGFIETANPAAAITPSFYGMVGGVDNVNTLKARQAMWAYTDRTGVARYRVYGAVNGVAGFYECDADGNVLSLTPVNLANEQLYLSPLQNGIAEEYIPGYARVISTNVTSMTDGTPVWDATTSAATTGTLGNDSSPNNGVVRSFDQVAYELDFVTELNTSLPDGTDISNYKGFENAKAYVRFEVPVTAENDVSFILSDMEWLKDGKATYDATNHKWILTGYRLLKSDSGVAVIPNRGTLNVIMRVNGAANAQTITPSASVWLDQGTDNGGTDLNAAYTPTAAETTTGFQTVRVTAAPKYNVGIKYLMWGSGQHLPNAATGDWDTGAQAYMMQHLVFTAEIRNDTPEKKLKGIEFPKGNFSFDVKVSTPNAGYDVDLWEYSDNTGLTNPYGYQNRYMNNSVALGAGAKDSNGLSASQRNTSRTYYDGGYFTASVQTISATEKIVHITIKDYRIDGVFPTLPDNDMFGVKYDANEGVFSIGNLTMMFKTNAVATTTTIPYTATISNLSASSSSGVTTTTDVYSADNSLTNTFTLYPPGTVTKEVGMQQLTADVWVQANAKMHLGETGYIHSNIDFNFAGTTTKVGAFNLFTKLDAEGFTVTGSNSNNLTTGLKKLYGALPSGGNWTSDTQMKDTREESLDWYTSLSAMGTKKCVAQMFEYRGEGKFIDGADVYLINGIYGYVPLTATVDKVYQTVSDLKVWTNEAAAGMTASVNTVTNNKGAANPTPNNRIFTNTTSIPGVSTDPAPERCTKLRDSQSGIMNAKEWDQCQGKHSRWSRSSSSFGRLRYCAGRARQ